MTCEVELHGWVSRMAQPMVTLIGTCHGSFVICWSYACHNQTGKKEIPGKYQSVPNIKRYAKPQKDLLGIYRVYLFWFVIA